jgi:protein O-mannosyl-transferase
MSRKSKHLETPKLPPGPPNSQRNAAMAVCGGLLLAVWIVFGPTVDYGFVNFDDNVYVYENPELSHGLSVEGIRWAFTTTRGSQWAPITYLSYLADYQCYGLKPWGYHLTNLLLHAATSVLLFLVLWRMTGELWPSAFVAAVFAIHPLQVESVAWITERKGLLSGLFFVLTLGAYLAYVRRPFSIARYAAVAVLFALGLMAKPMLVTLPCLLLLLDYWPLRRLTSERMGGTSLSGAKGVASGDAATSVPLNVPPGNVLAWRTVLIEKLPLLLISAGSSAIAPWAQGTAVISLEKLPLGSRISNGLASSVAYLGEFFWPMNLAVFYPHPGDAIPAWKPAAALLTLLAVTTAAIVYWRRNPGLIVGWFWYLGTLVPVIGLVQIGLHAMADRYMYLPLIGLSIAATWTVLYFVRSWPRRVWACAAAASTAIATLTVCASQQTSYWRDSESLWTRAVACTSQNNRAECNLAGELFKQKRFSDAIQHYRAAVAIEPSDAVSYRGLGDCLLGLGKKSKTIESYKEAVVQYEKALSIEPNHAGAHSNLANALAHLNRFDEAIDQYEAALKIEPSRDDIRHNLEVVRAMREKARQATGND